MPGVVTYLNLDKLISFLKSGFFTYKIGLHMVDARNRIVRTHTFTVFGTYIVFKIW